MTNESTTSSSIIPNLIVGPRANIEPGTDLMSRTFAHIDEMHDALNSLHNQVALIGNATTPHDRDRLALRLSMLRNRVDHVQRLFDIVQAEAEWMGEVLTDCMEYAEETFDN